MYADGVVVVGPVALAIAWEFRRRHRWGLLVLIGYLLVLAVIKLLILKPGQPVKFDDDKSFALVVIVPLSSTFMYFLAVFSFGISGDVAARQSVYPARLFTLPVTTAALVGWPMLYGTAAMSILWLAMRLLAIWPSDVDVPILWPALLAASLLAWTQALTWTPYALPGLRVIVTVLWLASIDAVVMLALQYKASEPLMLAILAPHIPLAYFAAYFAVARARRGDIPDWRGMFAWAGSLVLPFRRKHFASPTSAQVWFEWRRHGRSLPLSVAILLPFELALLFPFSKTPALVIETLFAVLMTPPFMAAFAAATVSKSNPQASDSYDLAPLIATRPLSSASLIAAKLKAAIWSTLAAWLLVLVAIPVALKLSGTSEVVIEKGRRLIELFGTPRAVAIVLLGFAALLATTWKQLVKSLYIGMSGREWLVKASVLVALSFLAIVVPFGHSIVTNRAVIATLWTALPWTAAVLVCFKLFAAAWIAARLRDNRLFSDRALVIGAACWAGLVIALYGLFAWLFPALVFRRYFLALVAILAIPLARLSAAPLALDSNRHGGNAAGEVLKHMAQTTNVAPPSGRLAESLEEPCRREAGATPGSRNRRKMVLAAVSVLISLPMVLALFEAVSFHVSNQNNGFIVSSGKKREYLLYIPKSYDHTKPTPLIISMHGAGGWPTQQMDLSEWNRLAESQRFLVVYPSGLDDDGPRTWSVDRGSGLLKDVRFISELIDKLEASYNIDPERIYANGFSNGGGMAFVLSCTLSDRIAAVGMVGAAQTLPWTWCTDHRPVPMITLHGTADRMAPYNGGQSPVAPDLDPFPSIPFWTAKWAQRNRCGITPIESTFAADVTRREYTNCAGNADVVLYTIRGGGHTWPGGQPLPEWFVGPTSRSIDGTNLMWEFFRAHPLTTFSENTGLKDKENHKDTESRRDGEVL